MLEVTSIADNDLLAQLHPVWDEFSPTRPYQFLAWQQAWLETLGRDTKTRILVAKSGDHVVGILPLALRTHAMTGTTLEFIGSIPGSTLGMGIWVKPTFERDVAASLAEYLFDRNPFSFTQLQLTGILEGDLVMREFADQIRQRTDIGFEKKQAAEGWLFRIQAGPDGDHIWPLCLRNASSAARKAFQSGSFTYQSGLGKTSTDGSVEAENLQTLMRLNPQKSAAQQTALRREEETLPFLNHVVSKLQDESGVGTSTGTLCVPILRWQSKPIAGAVAVVSGNTMHTFLLEVDRTRPAQTCLWLLHWAMVRDAARRGLKQLVYGPEQQQQIEDLRCTPMAVESWQAIMPGLSNRVRKTVQESASGLRFGTRRRPISSLAKSLFLNPRS
jgi:hypothetical protein